ncbi:terminase small subunit [Candidatus Avelusimicrobium faecicola]|uniref:terminase small subunit n=1 Tax=Candidatus Avelusimicrobium faecicola TaxID=3416205 RepID=UPI0020526F7A|nr:MAG TPA: DNA packaging protein gp3 [Caudoviricetes sp.]
MPAGKKKVKISARKASQASRKAVRETPVQKPTGRPAMFRTPEAMQAKIDEYFNSQVGQFPLLDRNGKQVYTKAGVPLFEERPPTVSGLALFLGFADRYSLYEYKQKAAFTFTVKRAIARIEHYAERGVMTRDKPTGAIFWLKNHGWTAEEESKNRVDVTLPEDWKRIAKDLGIGGPEK